MADRRKGHVLKRLVLCSILLTGALAYFRWYTPSPEEQIRRRLTGMVEQLSIERKESTLGRLARLDRALDHFASDVQVAVEGLDTEISSRAELRTALLSARDHLADARFQLIDLQVRFPESKTAAIAYGSVVARVQGSSNALGRELKFHLRQDERVWRVTRVESILQTQ